jgi:hypothetical protein
MVRSPGRRRRDPETTDAVRATIRSMAEAFEQDVTALSTTLARRQGLDTVSTKHVLDAAGFLHTPPAPLRIRLVGTGGGLLFGGATSNALALFGTATPSHRGIATTLAFGVVGGAAIVVGASRDR